ncbi:hypothetical protein [Neochlamydia sp. TUME1]|nr:hypothetical protein [Neochlamydia sp. TUME1]
MTLVTTVTPSESASNPQDIPTVESKYVRGNNGFIVEICNE